MSIYDEPRFDGRAMRIEQFLNYCRDLRAKDALSSVKTVVVHHSATMESLYDKQTLPQVLRNWWSYYRTVKGWNGGPHGVIMGRDPGIGILNVMTQDGIHCSNNNANSRGGEIVGNFTNALPEGALLDNAVAFFAGTLFAAKLDVDALRYHREYLNTECPGARLIANFGWFRGLIAGKLAELDKGDDPDREKIIASLDRVEEELGKIRGYIS